MEEEIEDLAEKLEELEKSTRAKDYEVRNCSNFDRKACLLQRRLEKLGGLSEESCAKELQEVAQSSLLSANNSIDKESSICNYNTETKSTDVRASACRFLDQHWIILQDSNDLNKTESAGGYGEEEGHAR